MILQSILVYIPAVLIGFLLVHLLWPRRDLLSLSLKVFIGIGVGLGIASLLYFVALLVAPGKIPFVLFQMIILFILLVIIIPRDIPLSFELRITSYGSRFQLLLFSFFLLVLLVTIASFINFSIRRDQGAFDAWMIYNRAARFIYRDTAHWQTTLSSELYWGFHPDYPLLIPLNVAWTWDAIGAESSRTPLIQSGLFLFATIGLMFTALAKLKGIGQASLAAILLMSLPGFIRSGSGQTADVPLAFYILASGILLFMGIKDSNKSLLALSGFMIGLAGWTKNEGLLAIAVSLVVVFFFFLKQGSLRMLFYYVLGLFFPMLVIGYFKAALAPPSDLFVGSISENLARVIDPFRYLLILKALWWEILPLGGWQFSMIYPLLAYGLLAGFSISKESAKGFGLLLAIMGLQLLGYLGVYLVTPHDLAWQLGTSFDRTVMQVFPSFLFLFFCCASEPEKIFP